MVTILPPTSTLDTLLPLMEARLRDVITQDQVAEAFRTVQILEPLRTGPIAVDDIVTTRLLALYWQAKFMAIPMLDETAIIELLRDHLPLMFELGPDYDLIDKVRGRCVGMPRYDRRDEFKTRLRLALLQSQAELTATNLIQGGNEITGTVSAWLTDVQRVSGTAAIPAAKIEEYLASGEQARRLTPDERQRLRVVLLFFEYTKKSSLTPEGLEERPAILDRDGKHKIMDATGQFVPYETDELLELARTAQRALGGPPIPYVAPEDESLAPIPAVSFIEREEVTSTIPALNAEQVSAFEDEVGAGWSMKTSGGIRTLSDVLHEALVQFNREKSVAVLRLLARANAVGVFLKDGQNIPLRQEFVESLKRKYGEAYTLAFEAHPDRIQFQTAFLDWLFREKLNLTETDAAHQREVIVTLLS